MGGHKTVTKSLFGRYGKLDAALGLLLIVLSSIVAFLVGVSYSQSKFENESFAFFTAGMNFDDNSELTEGMYSLYRSISGFNYIDKFAVEKLGDLFFCLDNYEAALLNYNLVEELVMLEQRPIDEITNVAEKIMAVENRNNDSVFLLKQEICE